MSQVRQFIDQLAAGESSAAKESLENILSGKAFESLDLYKKEIASSIFGGIEEEKECDTEKEDDEDEKEDKMKKEEFDQLDEVSKETLKSYVKKASVDAGTDQLKMIRRHKGDKVKTGAPKEGPDYRNIGKQREKGISKALDKLTKEDVEQIDELSIQTMKSAKDKLAGKAIAAHYDDNKVAARNLANRALKIGKKVDRKEWQQTNQKRLDQTAKYQKEDI